MNNTSKLFGWLLYLAGLGLVIAAFVLFLDECQEKNMFYMNMIVSCLIFSVAYFNVFDVYGLVSKVKDSTSSFGLAWIGSGIYLLSATALVVCSILLHLGFNLCLIVHLALIFVFCIFLFMGSIVKSNVNKAERDVKARKAGLDNINAKMTMLEIACSGGEGRQYLEAVESLKEELRFVTPSESAAALAVEDKIADKITLVTSQIERSTQPADVILAGLKDCKSLIELRKKQY